MYKQEKNEKNDKNKQRGKLFFVLKSYRLAEIFIYYIQYIKPEINKKKLCKEAML